MSQHNKVVWSEGMFLRPQHFQQQDRYIERFVEERCSAFGAYGWGIQELTIDQQLLTLGKISISSAKGVFPDGTPFSIPDIDPAPPILEISENVHNELIYLAIPLRRGGGQDIQLGEETAALARYDAREWDARDNASQAPESTRIQVGKLKSQLLKGSEDLSGYACVGVCSIVESREDKQIKLDEEYIPPLLDIHASTKLSGFLTELVGLLKHRAEALAGRLVDSGRAGSAEIADYMLLQLVNRLEPLTIHLTQVKGLHPERLFTELVKMAGELATFTTGSKRPTDMPLYLHEHMQATFSVPINALRQSLSAVLEQTAVSLELVERKYGIRVAAIGDHSMIGSSQFVLAAKADIPTETLRSRFPAQIKVGPVERIRQLVNAQLPGIGLRVLPVAPRQIPYHSGFTYFELDRSSEYWRELKQSGGFAVHVGGDFPGLDLEFWAIREK